MLITSKQNKEYFLFILIFSPEAFRACSRLMMNLQVKGKYLMLLLNKDENSLWWLYKDV